MDTTRPRPCDDLLREIKHMPKWLSAEVPVETGDDKDASRCVLYTIVEPEQ